MIIEKYQNMLRIIYFEEMTAIYKFRMLSKQYVLSLNFIKCCERRRLLSIDLYKVLYLKDCIKEYTLHTYFVSDAHTFIDILSSKKVGSKPITKESRIL